MPSQNCLSLLEKLRKDGKILGYEVSDKGVILLTNESFSTDEISSLDLNNVKIIRIKGKLEALPV